jgi:hypothetical protein
MRTTPLGVLFLSATLLWVGCTVESTSDDDDGGDSGEGGSAGSATGGKAGSTAGKGGATGGSAGSKGGQGGSTGGKGGYAGSAGSSGTDNGGSAGTYAGNAGAGPMDGGEGGWEPGAGGSGGEPEVGGEGGVPPKGWGSGGEGGADTAPAITDPVCDDENPGGTPYPDCEPSDAQDACEVCIQQSCCDESQACWAFAPGNVCGWGGPSGFGEIVCYTNCIKDWIANNGGACGTAAQDSCADSCVNTGCEAIGDQTWDLAVCMNTNCADECFGGSCG